MQCDDPWCLKACPKGAIVKDGTCGTVTVDETRCVGCRTCVSACPFGMIKYLAEKQKADKCDLCAGAPECVTFCPTGCLTLSEEDTPLRAAPTPAVVAGIMCGEIIGALQGRPKLLDRLLVVDLASPALSFIELPTAISC